MQMVFVLEVGVDAWLSAGGRVEIPRPSSCPACGHASVTFDGWYPRHTRRGRVAIQRVLCGNDACGQRSHSLLPDVLVSGRTDLASVIGWALEAKAAGVGHRPVAARLGVPAATVRGWLRRAGRRGGQVAVRLAARAAASDPAGRDPPGRRGGIELLVAAVAHAARAWSALSGEPVQRWRYAVMATAGRLLG
jgi:hypothetical protein